MNRLLCLLLLVVMNVSVQAQGTFKTESFVNGKLTPNDKTTITETPGQPPKIVYGSSRESTGWITTRNVQQAVDQGIEWQGKKAYLTLTFDVSVVDVKAKKTLWSDSVGAFWNTITFANLSKENEAARWVVVLGSTTHPEYQQRYDLDSGKKLELIGSPALPAGKPLTPRKTWSGSAGVLDTKTYQLVTSSEQWSKLRTELFGATPKDIPDASEIDFTQELLLVCYAGKTSNWNGIQVELAVVNDDRVLLRLQRQTYQSMGAGRVEHPYGLVVLPRLPGKDYVLEYNRQNLIGGPPRWQEFLKLTLPPSK